MKTLTIKHLPGLLILIGLAFIATPLHAAAPQDSVAFRNRMDNLWAAQATWTRLYLIDAAADLPSKDATADRLIQNQIDLGNAIKPFYGDAAGDKLAALLKEHIFNVMEFTTSARAKDWNGEEDANVRWAANADEIAAFFCKLNPRWTLPAMQSLWRSHVNFTIHEISARLKQHWKEDITAYDQLHAQALTIAGMLCDAILQQYPARFDPLRDVDEDLSGS
jgi:hypothetical protein